MSINEAKNFFRRILDAESAEKLNELLREYTINPSTTAVIQSLYQRDLLKEKLILAVLTKDPAYSDAVKNFISLIDNPLIITKPEPFESITQYPEIFCDERMLRLYRDKPTRIPEICETLTNAIKGHVTREIPNFANAAIVITQSHFSTPQPRQSRS